MERHQRLSYLISLRTEIAALLVVKCRMSHEQIIKSAGSNLPVTSRTSTGSYQRIGLCDPETRARQLGCGHTMSRYRLEAAISALGTGNRESAGQGALLGCELNELINEIHLLDHRKGEAEKALAIALEEAHGEDGVANGGDERLRMAEVAVREIEERHDEYVSRIGELRDKVVVEMDNLIEQLSSGDAG